jgi:hypothetical protein
MELVFSEYFTTVADALHTFIKKVSQDGGRLLITNRAFSSSSIVIPCVENWKMIPL